MKISICLDEKDCKMIEEDINDGFDVEGAFSLILDDNDVYIRKYNEVISSITCTNEKYNKLIDMIKKDIKLE